MLGRLRCTFFRINRDIFRNNHFECPKPDLEYLCQIQNKQEILECLKARKLELDITKLYSLQNKESYLNCDYFENINKQLLSYALLFPNKIHPDVLHLKEPIISKVVGQQLDINFQPKEFHELATKWGQIILRSVSFTNGKRTYFLKHDLARLEMALINYSLNFLKQKGFLQVSVPDIMAFDILKGCGLSTKEIDHQVFQLCPEWGGDGLCLSGTAENALAGLHAGHTLTASDLPLRLAGFSRCFRAEESQGQVSQNLFRVKQFYKVEMFGICSQDQSSQLLEEFVQLQMELFSSLGLHFQVLDMPPSDFNNAAHRKFDLEAWIPGRGVYGEISSASDCTDYQARRLGIHYASQDGGTTRFCHTVNGTACAVPRMLMAICETHQTSDGTVSIPSPLRPHLDGQHTIPHHNVDHKCYWLKAHKMTQGLPLPIQEAPQQD